MFVTFNEAHMRTFAKLQEIALKHNCTIRFGANDFGTQEEIDYDILKANELPDEIFNDLKAQDDSYGINNAKNHAESLWFELYDKKVGKLNQLVYIESSTSFILKGGDDLMIENAYEHEAFCNWINGNEYDGFFEFHDNPTRILGFGKSGWREDYRVYRSGMALKFFADLVCEYLHEPEITETY